MSTNLITKPFTLLTTKELEQALNSIQLKEDTLFKLKSNDTVGYDLTFEIDAYLKQIDIQNIHEINLIKKFVNKNINDQLKLTIKLNQNQQIVIQLDNDINIVLNEIIEYLSRIESVKQDEIFLSPIDSNELLLPSVKIVKLILEQPNQYSILKLFDKSTMNSDNTNKHSLRHYNNTTNLDRDIYAISYSKFNTSNTARNSSTLLQEKFNISGIDDKNNMNENHNNNNKLNYQKKYNNYTTKEKEEINSNNNNNNSNNNQTNYYQYNHNLSNNSKSHSNLINQNQQSMNHTNSEIDNVSPFPSTNREAFNNNNNNNITNLRAKSYTTYNSITEKYRKYGKNIDEKDNNDNNNNKDEYNQYIKKGYGFYQPLTSDNKSDSLNENVQNNKRENEQEGEVESPQPNNHMKIETSNLAINMNVHNKDSRKYSSERRNYRQYEGSRTPEHNNNIDLYKKYDKYSSNNDKDNNNKQYALSPNYNQRHLKGDNIVTPSNTATNNINTTNSNTITNNNNINNNISAYELRNKVNSMRNQLNAYASLNPVNNNKNGESHKKEGFKTNNNSLNYKLFPQENDDSNENISNDNLNNINIDSSSNKESCGYSKRPFKYEP